MSRASIATVAGTCSSVDDVVRLADQLDQQLEQGADLVIASYTSVCDLSIIVDTLSRRYRNAAVTGASTCRGAMTAVGLVAFGEANLSLWGLCDADGDYGVGYAEIRGSAAEAAEAAVEMAFERCGRVGELPGLIWMHTSPGVEEEVVSTLDALFDGDVSIVGGTAADETLEGSWSCFAGDEYSQQGVAITLFFSSYEISTSFQSGYAPTAQTGIATRCKGRTVYEINHQPAVDVYSEWCDRPVNPEQSTYPVSVLQESTLTPFGIAVGDVSGIPYYSLVLPETFTRERGMTFLCEVPEGQQLTLMSGNLDNIISRPGRVANQAIYDGENDDAEVLGGLVVFCGGCLLAVESRVSEIVQHLNNNMHGAPFLGSFTLGEQGRLLGGENRHGNLMTSVTVFKR